jgi:hypothetical protein
VIAVIVPATRRPRLNDVGLQLPAERRRIAAAAGMFSISEGPSPKLYSL